MKKFMRTRAAPPAPAADHPPCASNGHAISSSEVAATELHSLTRIGSEDGSRPPYVEGECGAPLWEDPEFPATRRALGVCAPRTALQWLRPQEMCAQPMFRGAAFGSGARLRADGDADDGCWSDAGGGALRDSAVRTAVAALAQTPSLLDRVAPRQPAPAAADYSGAYRFRFWVWGEWREVRVDDRLPTRRGRPLAARPAAGRDFALPLLEKAYAKLYGSYAALRCGGPARALQDLTGGVVQSLAPARLPLDLLFQVVNSAVPRSTLVVSVATVHDGLAAGEPYWVCGLARVRGAGAEPHSGSGALVLVRAAGGAEAARGLRVTGSAEWRALSPADRDLLAARADHPSLFWMPFEEFARCFSSLVLVHVGPDDWALETELRARRPWRAALARRRWRRGYNAGGPPRCLDTTGTNPMFCVCVGAGAAEGGKCRVVVSVTQRYEPGARAALPPVGFAVYALPAGAALSARRPPQLHALRALEVAHESAAREVASFCALPAGRYLLVPHARVHRSAAFLLRVLTDERVDVWEVNDDNVVVRDVAAECLRDPRLVPEELAATARRLAGGEEEVEAGTLRALLRRAGRRVLCARPSLALCDALVAQRDAALRGSLPARELPALLAQLAQWRAAGPARRGASSYELRELLLRAGIAVSNKVLEALVVRFARDARLSPEAFYMALARLHLAHERYRGLDARLKSNPLSLEEMILMTVYS